MIGVEVLTTEEVVTGWGFNWLGSVFTFIIVILVVELVCIKNCKTTKELLQGVGIFGVIVGLIAGLFTGYAAAIPTKYETHYKVTISDEVPLNEFLERYEIVDQEGRIYTIRELE